MAHRLLRAAQPVPQGAGTGRELSGSSDRLDGQRSHLPDGDISNPCPTGAPLLISGTTRRNPPDSPAFLPPDAPDPRAVARRTRTAYPARSHRKVPAESGHAT